MRLGAVFVLIFLTGIGLAPFIFWYPLEGLVGISLLAIGILGMTIAIKKIRNSKCSNPEAYNAMITEDRNKLEKTVKLEDLPVWLIVLL
jgi:mannose/fructose/N-acetylgalactosamine-specific phosphotransferase system component IIC